MTGGTSSPGRGHAAEQPADVRCTPRPRRPLGVTSPPRVRGPGGLGGRGGRLARRLFPFPPLSTGVRPAAASWQLRATRIALASARGGRHRGALGARPLVDGALAVAGRWHRGSAPPGTLRPGPPVSSRSSSWSRTGASNAAITRSLVISPKTASGAFEHPHGSRWNGPPRRRRPLRAASAVWADGWASDWGVSHFTASPGGAPCVPPVSRGRGHGLLGRMRVVVVRPCWGWAGSTTRGGWRSGGRHR